MPVIDFQVQVLGMLFPLYFLDWKENITAEGFENTFATNYYGPFLLTTLLLGIKTFLWNLVLFNLKLYFSHIADEENDFQICWRNPPTVVLWMLAPLLVWEALSTWTQSWPEEVSPGKNIMTPNWHC